jgi:hypothetical protein
MGQKVKLRRSAVAGKKPLNSQIELGELSVNTTDGKVFLAKSGSQGPSVEEIIITNTQNTGSIDIIGSVSASFFTGSFVGDGRSLYNIPASGVTGLSLDQIANGSSTASIDNDGLHVNVDTSITGSLTATEFTGSGLGLTNVPFYITGSDVNGVTYGKTFTKLQFDDSTGLNVSESSPDTAFISIGSHFRDIFIEGSDILRATGSDAFEIKALGGLQISTSVGDTNSNGYEKELIFDLTDFSSSIKDQFDIVTGSLSSSGEGRTARLEITSATSTWTFNHNLNEQYPAITVFDSDGNVIVPQNIDAVSTTQLVVSFASPQTGVVSATVGGGLPTLGNEGSVLVVSGSVAAWKDGILSSSLYTMPETTGSFGVETLVDNGDGTTTFEVPKTIYEYVKNVSGGPLDKGTPVHVIGVVGFNAEVVMADAGDPDRMPATYILNQDLQDEEEGLGIAIGHIQGVDTRGLTAGEPVYVAVGGGWTQTPPTGSALIQNLGILTKIDQNGGGVVLGAGRTNAVPNLLNGQIFYGQGNVATQIPLSDVITGSNFAYTGSFTGSFVGDGTNLYNIPASGVTGLSLDKIASGGATASISPTELITNVSILPDRTDTIDLGSPDKQWRDLYLSSGSLYINGQQVLSTTGTELRVTTDSGESIKIIETDSDTITLQTDNGDITLSATGTGNIELDAPIQITAGNKILSSDGNSIVFGNGLVITGSIELNGTVDGVDIASMKDSFDSVTGSNDGRLNSLETESGSIRGDFNTYTSSNDGRLVSLETTSASHDSRLDAIEGGLEFTGSNVTIKGDLLVKGTETRVDSTTVNLSDNIISLNGSGAVNGGIEVRDVTSPAFLSGSLLWDSTNNYWIAGVKTSEERILLDSDLTTLNQRLSSLEADTGSQDGRLDSLETTSGSHDGRLNALETISGSHKDKIYSLELTSGSHNTRLGNLETASGSIRTDFNSYTSSNDTRNVNQDDRLSQLEIKTGSLDGDISTLDGRVDALETESGSIRTDFNSYTSSNNTLNTTQNSRLSSLETTSGSIIGDISTLDGRVDSLETQSGSIRSDFNSYTSSNNTTNNTQNSRLTSLESVTGSYLTSYSETQTLEDVATLGNTTTLDLEARSFIVTGANGSQFLKGDGSLDNNTYLTGYTETDTLESVVSRGGTTPSWITVGSLLVSNTAPLIDLVDTNSFTDTNDRFRIRAAGNVGQVRWYDASAQTDSVLMTFNPDGTIGVDGSIDMGTNIITDTKVGQWDTAYGWGDHGTVGYITGYTETDPIFAASEAYNITSGDTSNWDTAYGWGNHSSVGYITGYTETDTLSSVTSRGATTSNDITISKSSAIINMGYQGGPHGINFYDDDGSTLQWGFYYRTSPDTITFESGGNTPKFTLDTSGNLTVTGTFSSSDYNKTNWDTAYSWGNHADVGYITGYTDTNYYTTGATFSSNTITFTRNDGGTYDVNLNSLVDVTVTGGTYNDGTATLRLNKSDGNSVDITGFTIDTNTYITGHTFSGGTLTSTRNNGTSIDVSLDGRYVELAGDTMSGDLQIETIQPNIYLRETDTQTHGRIVQSGGVLYLQSSASGYTGAGEITFGSHGHTTEYGRFSTGGNLTITGRFLGDQTESNTTPAYTFSGDSDTGLSRIGADQVGLIAGGSRKFYVSGTNAYFQNLTGGVTISTDLEVTGTATIAQLSLTGESVAGQDLDAVSRGLYYWGSSQPSNGSTGYNYMSVLTTRDTGQNIQLAFGSSGRGRILVRRADSGTYYPWTEFWNDQDFSSTDITNWGTAYTYSQVGHLPLAGGTMTGDIDMGGKKITNLYGIVLNNEELTDLTLDGQIAFDLNDTDAPATLGTYGGVSPDGLYFRGSSTNYQVYHTGHFSGTHISNWQTAYGWGDHSTAGYITGYTESQTLDDVTSLGSTTTNNITIGRLQSGTNASSDSSIISQTGDIQLRVGSVGIVHSPFIRLQGKRDNGDGTTTAVYGDIKLDTVNQKLVLNDPGNNGSSIGTNPTTLDSSGNLEVNGTITIASGTTYRQSHHMLYVGGDGLASIDAAIYIGNRSDGTGYGWELFYDGTGSGNLNSFILRSENLGSPVDTMTVLQDGTITFAGTVDVNSKLTANSGFEVSEGGAHIKNTGASQSTVLTIEQLADVGSSADLVIKTAFDRDVGIKFETLGGYHHLWQDSNGDDALIISAAGSTRSTDATIIFAQDHSVNIPNGGLTVAGTLTVNDSTRFNSYSDADPDATSITNYGGAHTFTYYGESYGLSVIGGQGSHAGTTLLLGQETNSSTSYNYLLAVADTNGTPVVNFKMDGGGNFTSTGDITTSGGSVLSDIYKGYTYSANSFLDFDDDNGIDKTNTTTLSSVGDINFIMDSNGNGPSDKFNFLSGSTNPQSGTTLMTLDGTSLASSVDVTSTGLYIGSAGSIVSGTQVAIVGNTGENLQRWGSTSDGSDQNSYRFRIDQNYNFIGNSGGGDTITLDSSNGTITASGRGTFDTLELTSGGAHLTFTQSGDDWFITNNYAGYNNGISIYNGSGGVDIVYDESTIAQFDGNGVTLETSTLVKGLLTVTAGAGSVHKAVELTTAGGDTTAFKSGYSRFGTIDGGLYSDVLFNSWWDGSTWNADSATYAGMLYRSHGENSVAGSAWRWYSAAPGATHAYSEKMTLTGDGNLFVKGYTQFDGGTRFIDLDGTVDSIWGIYGWGTQLQFTKRDLTTDAHAGTPFYIDYGTSYVYAGTGMDTPTITVGGITLEDASDRSGLLEINRKGSTSWTGTQARFSSTAEWSIMGNETQFGAYDDQNSDWIWIYTENGGLELKYNTSTKITTTNTGALISGQLVVNESYSALWDATTPGLTTGNIHLMSIDTDHAGPGITFDASDANNAQAGIYVKSDGNYGTKMYFATTDSYATGSKSAIEIDHSGVVNILRNTLNGSTIYASSQLQAGGTGELTTPTATMRFNAEGFQFGGGNNGKEINSAQISAGWHQANSLNIVGMSSDTTSSNRRVDIWAEAGLYLQGSSLYPATSNTGEIGNATYIWNSGYFSDLYVDGYIYHGGDTNTYIRMIAADDMQLVAGGRQMIRMDEGTDPDKLRFVTDNDWTNSSGDWNMSGNVTVGGTLTESSSIRYKEDIVDLEYGLKDVLAMRPVTYKKKSTGNIEVGLIAEEIHEIVPEIIKYNEENEVDGLNYSRLTSILVNAIKELNNKVVDLEKKLNG